MFSGNETLRECCFFYFDTDGELIVIFCKDEEDQRNGNILGSFFSSVFFIYPEHGLLEVS